MDLQIRLNRLFDLERHARSTYASLLMNYGTPPKVNAAPDFDNLLAVLDRSKPNRPTLFEFFLNLPLYRRLAGVAEEADFSEQVRIQACRNAGYDYSTILVPGFNFPAKEKEHKETVSLNEGAVISDRKSLEQYEWVDPDQASYEILDQLDVPDGMKLVAHGPSGVLENTIRLVGYESLCYITIDDPQLAQDIFDGVGSRLLRYYENVLAHDSVGAIIGNDDWGFKSQPMLSPEQMRQFVFPWHKKIVAAAHAAGKPAILHSCGCLTSVMDDIIDDIGYDGKHSYEDTIQPVEEAYEQYHKRIAVMGGIDMDYVCRSTPDEVHERSKKMLARAEAEGAYGLGTGNSVPKYVPDENYFAMITAIGRE